MKKLEQQLQERIKTVEDAYNEIGRPKVDFSGFPEDMQVYEKNHYDALVLVEAARKIEKENGLEEIDWSKKNQAKWIPWFWMSPSAFAFGDACCAYGNALAGSGSRLYLLSETAAGYIGKTFPEVWKNVQLG